MPEEMGEGESPEEGREVGMGNWKRTKLDSE